MDYLGEFEPHNTIYILTVYIPLRPPPSCIPGFIFRENVSYKDYDSKRDFRIPHDPPNHDRNAFGPRALDTMETKQIKIKSYRFPLEMRCPHLQGKSMECKEGCYFLEKPIKKLNSQCKRVDCEGHVYGGWRMEGKNGVECFGKKGKRLVTVMSYEAYTASHRALSETKTIKSPPMENTVCVHIVYLPGNC